LSQRIVFRDLIVFESEDLIAINKPPYIPSLHERFDKGGTSIIEMAKNYHPDLMLCHRLDRETSGVMLIAKNPEAYRMISLQFENREIKKEYHAIVAASVMIENLEINLSLYTDSKRRVQISRKEGKPSLTIVNTLKQYKHFTILTCQPVTGRLHQIRIHCASQNLPLVADELYGGKKVFLSDIKRKVKVSESQEEKPMITRFALHAYKINFTDRDGKSIEVIAPYAKDFEVFVKLLDKYDGTIGE
jgi:23S rRNA pseudouridine955/2504/2580 synthase